MKEIIIEIENIWEDIKNKKTNKTKVFKKLFELNKELKTYEDHPNKDILYDLSQNILALYELLTLTKNDEELYITYLKLKEENEVYYVFYKSQIKEFTLGLEWFFPLYQKTKTIAENKDFIIVRDKKISTLAFVASLIFDKNRDILYYRKKKFLEDFYISMNFFK